LPGDGRAGHNRGCRRGARLPRTRHPTSRRHRRTGPAELRLQFSEAIELPFCRVDLATQDGEKIETGPLSTDPDDERQLVLAVRRELVPGFYRVSWRVVSRDTHVTQGEYTFEVRP
jgi:hypothetical protein